MPKVHLRLKADVLIDKFRGFMSVVCPSVDRIQHLTKDWMEYRRKQRIAGLMAIGFIPLAVLIAVVIENLSGSDGQIAIFEAPLAVSTFASWSLLVLFRCTSCRQHYHLTDTWRLTGGRRCPHCGIERYQIT